MGTELTYGQIAERFAKRYSSPKLALDVINKVYLTRLLSMDRQRAKFAKEVRSLIVSFS